MQIEMELAAPAFLIAVPQLGDPNFLRTVVLIIEHNENGSMGLVISRPSDLTVGAFCDGQGIAFAGDEAALVHLGGPVQTDRAFILHSPGAEGPETEEVLSGMRLSYSIESLKLLAATPPQAMRVYLGYAGWGPGQLADEITEGAWLLHHPDSGLVLGASATEAWEITLRAMGIDPAHLAHSGAIH